jgi:hypothetical protein
VAAGLAHRESDGTVVFRQLAEPAAPSPAPSTVDVPVQRADPPEPAPAAPAAPTGPAEIDELVRRIYEPIAARLRAELRIDRERAGMLTDLRR